MRSHSHLNTANYILQSYHGDIPLAAWLKEFFKTEKKFGSTDRKQISHLCYCFFRLGNAFIHLSTEEKLLVGVFLCSTITNKIIEEIKPDWDKQINLPLHEKLLFLSSQKEIPNIFPFSTLVTREIDAGAFNKSFVIQPDLFIRIRPGYKIIVKEKLERAGLSFKEISSECLSTTISTKVKDVLEIDKEAVIQDMNSQKTLDVLNVMSTKSKEVKVWDCCAASGGKTILLHDHFPKAQLTVSDIRESILHNLKARFKRAGIEHYQSFIADVSSSTFLSKQKYDVIICDAPCSGSGTWSRTPEQLSFFQKERIDIYSNLQKKIVVNAARSLKIGGYFLYITCSVFKKENEDVADYIVQNTGMKLIKQEYFKGYADKADTLFAALFLL